MNDQVSEQLRDLGADLREHSSAGEVDEVRARAASRRRRRRVTGAAVAVASVALVAAAVPTWLGDRNAGDRSTVTPVATGTDPYPAAVYPAAKSFPDWGMVSGCPDDTNLEPAGTGDTAGVVALLDGLGATLDQDRARSDRAYWPALDAVHAADPGATAQHVTAADVAVRPAAQSELRDLLTHSCGAAVVGNSVEAVVCGDGTSPCDPTASSALHVSYIVLKRAGRLFIWFSR
jgi:hypothetical protein